MGAVKEFYHECYEAGFIPLRDNVLNELEILQDDLGLDWIEYMTHPYLGFDNQEFIADGISVSSGIRLVDRGVDLDEITTFLEDWSDYV